MNLADTLTMRKPSIITQGWIGVDLDGTLAKYERGSFGVAGIGDPIPAMLQRVKRWIAEGRTVKIFTARVAVGNEREKQLRMIEEWLEENGIGDLEVTNVKDYDMIELYDDRAVAVEMNTGRLLSPSKRGL